MKRIILLMLLVSSCGYGGYAQTGDFCSAVSAILHDAPLKFRNIRGKVTDANANATQWECGITVPGTIKSRFIASMGMFYEGAFLQSNSKDDLKAMYDECKARLDSCLIPKGYTLSFNDNFYTGLADYKKLVYMSDQVVDERQPENAPPHLTLEVAYSKEMGLYTIVMYIFEH